jgi:magnesium transporter
MGFIARRLTFLRQRLWSKRDILTSLIERDWQAFLTGVKVPYLRDIYDHLVIMLHKLDSAIEVVGTLQSTYLAVVSIDVAAVANDGNKAMKTLSAAATILLPLSLIASLMGMNVKVPFQFDSTRLSFIDLLPFSIICVCMGLISYYLYSYFRKRQYL